MKLFMWLIFFDQSKIYCYFGYKKHNNRNPAVAEDRYVLIHTDSYVCRIADKKKSDENKQGDKFAGKQYVEYIMCGRFLFLGKNAPEKKYRKDGTAQNK